MSGLRMNRTSSIIMNATKNSDSSQTVAGAVAMDEEQMRKNIMDKLKKMKEAVDCEEACDMDDQELLD